ncbi:hypothetical protein AB1Y20_016269 [Prymnesium parvum]|uniref:Uncharacterized protein n=1 Tax=Prymnesium parvum TaxID=97485 RepID=A0AB34IFV7_PRYPA
MATGAANVPPANAPAAPPARLGASAAATRLTRPAAPPGALDPDEWAVARDCPALTSLRGAGGICISACTFNLTEGDSLRSLRSSNLIEHLLSIAACSNILHELHDARIFSATYDSEADFVAAVQESPLVRKPALLFAPTWLESSEPFDSPAVAGVAATAARRGAPAVRAVPAVPTELITLGEALTTSMSVASASPPPCEM